MDSSDKTLSEYQQDNEADLFVFIKQAKKHGADAKQLISKLSLIPFELPIYRLDSTIDRVLGGIDALGYFEQRVTVLQKREYGVETTGDTVLVIIKFTKNLVPLRFRCASCKLKFCRYFTKFSDI